MSPSLTPRCQSSLCCCWPAICNTYHHGVGMSQCHIHSIRWPGLEFSVSQLLHPFRHSSQYSHSQFSNSDNWKPRQIEHTQNHKALSQSDVYLRRKLKSLICIIWEERIKRKSHCAIIAWQNTKETWQSTYEIDGLFLLKWAVSLRCFSGRESRATAGCH